jgi:hypothetical protein
MLYRSDFYTALREPTHIYCMPITSELGWRDDPWIARGFPGLFDYDGLLMPLSVNSTAYLCVSLPL